MNIRLYIEEDSMRRAFVIALRANGVDVITALEALMVNRADDDHLEYAIQQGCVLYSFNRGDFYRLHTKYLSEGLSHTGILLANQQQYAIGEEVRRIMHLTSILSADDMKNRVEFLSAW